MKKSNTKAILSAIIASVTVLASCPTMGNVCFSANAESVIVERSDFTYIVDGETAKIIAAGPMNEVVIPETIDGLTVTSIGKNVFELNEVTSVIFPETVTEIETGAFRYCKKLETVKLPENLTVIEDSLFEDCESLKNVNIPGGLERIGKKAFSGCASLEEIKMPDSVAEVGGGAFSGCSSLRSVTLSPNITKLVTEKSGGVFENCTSLEKIFIPKNVTTVDSSTFEGCSSLEEIEAEQGSEYFSTVDGVLFNADGRFLRICPEGKKESTYTVPETVTAIESGAFTGALHIKKIIIPENVERITASAFWECEGLEEVTLPSKNINIAAGTFCRCPNLRKVNFPDTIYNIFSNAFLECTSLESVEIPDRTAKIDTHAFDGCKSLSVIALGNGLKEVGNYAFKDCPVTDVYFSGSEDEWKKIKFGKGNEAVTSGATIHFNSRMPQIQASGDVNGDDVFDVADLVTVQTFILGNAPVETIDIREADFIRDGRIDVFDFVEMKKTFLLSAN